MKMMLPVLLLASGTAVAATVTVSWNLPSQNEDGSPIPATGSGSLAQTRVEYGSCTATGGFGIAENSVVVPYPGTSTTIDGFVGGETVCFRATVKNNLGVESSYSATVSKTFDAPKPKPPVLISTITLAYEVSPNRDGSLRLGRDVGTIELGTECLDGQIGTNKGIYYQVSNDKVALYRKPRSQLLVTKCVWA